MSAQILWTLKKLGCLFIELNISLCILNMSLLDI